MVVVEQSAKSFSDVNAPDGLRLCPVDESVADTLVAAFLVVMLDELFDRSVERSLPQKDHLAKTLGLDGPDESFRVDMPRLRAA
jgi:hypothetical protein